MLPKKNRNTKKEVNEIFTKGRFLGFPGLDVKFLSQKGAKKFSVIASKSLARDATSRNRLRRVGYRILKGYQDHWPQGVRAALILKTKNSLELEASIKKFLTKLQ